MSANLSPLLFLSSPCAPPGRLRVVDAFTAGCLFRGACRHILVPCSIWVALVLLLALLLSCNRERTIHQCSQSTSYTIAATSSHEHALLRHCCLASYRR